MDLEEAEYVEGPSWYLCLCLGDRLAYYEACLHRVGHSVTVRINNIVIVNVQKILREQSANGSGITR